MSQITSVSAKVNVGGVQTLYTGFVLNTATGYWEKSITAPNASSYLNNSGHYYPVTATATDAAGNTKTVTENDFDTLRLFVREMVEPVITLSGVTEGTTTNNAKPTFIITVTDNGSGASTSGAYVKIDSGTNIPLTFTKTTDYTATATFIPQTSLSDGSHTLKFFAFDNDGNRGSVSVTFSVLTSIPSLTVDTPSGDILTKETSLTVSGTTNSDTGNTVTITVDGTDAGSVTVSSGAYSKVITFSEDGEHTVVVTATNAAGTQTQVTRTVTVDTLAPVFDDVKINPQPFVIGQNHEYIIKIKVH